MTGPEVSVLELHVRDLEASAAFYRDVIGVDLGMDDDGPDAPHYEGWWPPTADRSYLFLALWEATAEDPPSRLMLGFQVDDLDAVHARSLTAGAHVVSAPADGPYGRRAELRDPDGNRITVGQR